MRMLLRRLERRPALATATNSEAMMLTIPFVVFGVFRYLYLVHRRDIGEEPERVLIRDVPTLLTVAAWAVSAALILVLTD